MGCSGWGGPEKQTRISTKSKSLFSPSWSSCCPGSLNEQDDRTSRMEKYKLFFWQNPGNFFNRVPGAGCRRVPGFYKVLIWGGRGRSAPRASSGIERGLPPNLQVHQPSCLPAVSAARRLRASSVGLSEFAAHRHSILRVGLRRGSPGIERGTAPKFAAHQPHSEL